MRNVRAWFTLSVAVVAGVHAMSAVVYGSATREIPEIGPGSLSAAAAILAGGILMLRARRGSK